MATKTGIEWTDYSINLIRYRDADNRDVWACVKCSDGCKHCYAESLAHRFRRGKAFTAKNMTTLTPYFDDKAAAKLLRSRKLTGKRVFVGDMTDVFGPWVPFDLIDKLFAVMALRPDVTFQVLTKRPERIVEYFRSFSPNYQRARIAFNPYIAWSPGRSRALDIVSGMRAFRAMRDEPLPNVWLGCSIEDQKTADERIPHLLRCSAAVRFLSAEPLLGAVDLREYIGYNPMYENTQSRSGSVRSGATGPVENRPGRVGLESGRASRQSLERKEVATGGVAKAGGESDGALHAGAVDEGGEADSLPGASLGMDALPRTDSRGLSNQSSERGQAGQPAGEPGTGDGQRQQEALLPRGNVRRARPEKSSGQTDGLADSSDSHDVSGRHENTKTDCGPIRGVSSGDLKDRSRRSTPEAERPNDELRLPTVEGDERPGSHDRKIHLVIAGGESGSGARPCNVEWIRSIVGQCKAASVPVFCKQIGSRPRVNYYDFLRWCEARHWDDNEARIITESGAEWRVEFDGQPPLDALAEFPNRRGDGKGSDPAEWPDDLRVREMPEVRS